MSNGRKVLMSYTPFGTFMRWPNICQKYEVWCINSGLMAKIKVHKLLTLHRTQNKNQRRIRVI